MTTAATVTTPAPTTAPPIGHNVAPAIASTPRPPDPIVLGADGVTVTLARPIADGGKTLATLTLPPMTLMHKIASEARRGGAEQTVALIAALAGVGEDAVRTLALRDLRTIERAMRQAAPARLPAIEPNALGISVTLSQPITIDAGTKVERLAIREPDVEASIAVEAVARNVVARDGNGQSITAPNGERQMTPLNPSEQTAAMLASLTGLTIPEIGRLRMIDVAAIEGWLLPFVVDTSSSEAVGGTSP